MMTRRERRAAWPGFVLIAGLTASLMSPGVRAHEIAHEHDGAPAVRSANAPEHATATLAQRDAEIGQLVAAFRATGIDEYLDRAWAILEPMLDAGRKNPHLLVTAATVAQSRHEFDRALSLIDQALVLAPNNDQAWLLRAAIHLVRGNVDESEQACRELRHVPAVVAVTCRARVSVARGEHEATLRRMAVILQTVDPERIDAQWLAWMLSVTGDAAAPVDTAQAISFYERSLRVIESTQVRAALVDVLLVDNRLELARDALQSGSDALPLTVRRLIVATRSDQAAGIEREIAAADHEFRHWIAKEDWLHAREMARFYVDVLERPALARRLAERNLTMQSEPEDLLLERRTRALLLASKKSSLTASERPRMTYNR